MTLSNTQSGCRATAHPAVLLLGPTGTGKTPLGELLAAQGFLGRRCRHFDFGQQLRAAGAGGTAGTTLSPAELRVIRVCLRRGALLENENFGIARKILADFIAGQDLRADDRLILNGLPRHVDQARMLKPLTRVELVVTLDADPETVQERIRRDSGGDRQHRTDDTPAAIRRRLATYLSRTLPLIEYYRVRGAAIIRFPIAVDTTAGMIAADLERRHKHASADKRATS